VEPRITLRRAVFDNHSIHDIVCLLIGIIVNSLLGTPGDYRVSNYAATIHTLYNHYFADTLYICSGNFRCPDNKRAHAIIYLRRNDPIFLRQSGLRETQVFRSWTTVLIIQDDIGDLKQWYNYRHAYFVALHAAFVSKLSDIVLAAIMSTVFKEQGKHPQQFIPLFIYATYQNNHWFIVSRPRETAQRLFRSPRDLVRSQYITSRNPLYIYMLRQAQQPMARKRSMVHQSRTTSVERAVIASLSTTDRGLASIPLDIGVKHFRASRDPRVAALYCAEAADCANAQILESQIDASNCGCDDESAKESPNHCHQRSCERTGATLLPYNNLRLCKRCSETAPA
jgi:hypothetical protein